MNLVITKSGSELAEGTPELYVSDSDFNLLLNNVNGICDQFFQVYERNICVGRLGKKDGDVFIEDYGIIGAISLDDKKGELCYYEKIR